MNGHFACTCYLNYSVLALRMDQMIRNNISTYRIRVVAYVNTTITATAIIISIACLLHYIRAAAMNRVYHESACIRASLCVCVCLFAIHRTHPCTEMIVDLNWFL